MGNQGSTANPEPGDLIEISRVGFKHWAVYVGGGYVVHLTASDDLGVSVILGSSQTNKKAIVKKETLKDAVQDSKWKINNLLDDKYPPRENYVIVKDAHRRVGTELQYNLLDNNCEHFSTQLRYGKGESQQVRRADKIVMALGVGGILDFLSGGRIRSRPTAGVLGF